MKQVTITVTAIEVVERKYQPDMVYVNTTLSSPFISMEDEPFFKIECSKGYGADWVRKNFGIEPKIITM